MNESLITIGRTISSEFSDLNDLGDLTIVVIRLLLAAILGGLLGVEREQRGKPAGVRTHMLVCMGACVFVLIPEQSGISEEEMSRVIQGVVAGIGFLCAGAIIKGNDEQHLTGLTTAAGIWFTAAIGLAVGLGREQTAILCAVLAWLVLFAVPKFSRMLRPGRPPTNAETDEDK